MIAAAGLVLMLAAILRSAFDPSVAGALKASAALRTDGVYSIVPAPDLHRHRGHCDRTLSQTPNRSVAAATALVVGFLMAKLRFEERLLVEHYPAYAAYQKRTWGLSLFAVMTPDSHNKKGNSPFFDNNGDSLTANLMRSMPNRGSRARGRSPRFV